jgi:hypothetical protein
LTIPNTFSNDTRADAEEVNANFTAVKTAVDDNDARINALSESRNASVTYSAMGFTPSDVITTESIEGNITNIKTTYTKNPAQGSLALIIQENGTFYHSVTLPSGVIITRMHARVSGAVRVDFKMAGEAGSIVTLTGTQGEPHNMESDSLEHKIMEFPVSYFIEVTFGNRVQRLYSVAIEYEYPEP